MQDIIKVYFNTELEFTDLLISVNKTAVNYQRSDDHLVVTVQQHLGVNILRIQLKESDQQFEVKNVKINDCSLRMCLYLSYTERHNQISQPDTVIKDTEQTWVLPYGSPISFWLSLVPKKFRNSEFGKNLYDKYLIYYPEPHSVPNSFPRLIQDYFNYDFDFTVVNRSTAQWADIPYLPLLVRPDPSKAYEEIIANLDFFYKNKTVAGQLKYNQADNTDLDPDHWAVWWFGRGKNYKDDLDELPEFRKFVTDLNIQGTMVTGFIAFTKPGSFASPHVDDIFLDREDYQKVSGCAQLYIPISPRCDDAEIKLAGVGILPHEPLVFNNDRFIHGVYNNSNKLRIFLSLRVDPNLNQHLFRRPGAV